MNRTFTSSTQKVFNLAENVAANKRMPINTVHLILGILLQKKGIAACALSNFDICENKVSSFESKFKVEPHQDGVITMRPDTMSLVVSKATEKMRDFGSGYIGTEHVLLGILEMLDSDAYMMIESFGVNPDSLRREVLYLLGNETNALKRKVVLLTRKVLESILFVPEDVTIASINYSSEGLEVEVIGNLNHIEGRGKTVIRDSNKLKELFSGH